LIKALEFNQDTPTHSKYVLRSNTRECYICSLAIRYYIGSGKNLPQNMMVTLPAAMKVPENDVEGLVNTIYPQIPHGVKPDEYFLDRTILCCKNDAVETHLKQEDLRYVPRRGDSCPWHRQSYQG
jgi:hypothetical protein